MDDKLSNVQLKSNKIQELEQERLLLLEIIKQQGSYDLTPDAVWEIVAHELRTPLVPILGYVDLLLEDKLGVLDNKQIQRLKVVQSSTKSLVETINKIIDTRNLETCKK